MVSVAFFWLKQIPIHQLTHNLCFNISFRLYIHDLVLDEPIGTLPIGVNTDIGKQLCFMVFGYIFWAQTDTNHQLTPNLCFNIPFHFYIHDLVLDESTN